MFVLLKPKTLRRDSDDFGILEPVILPRKCYLHGTDEYTMVPDWLPFATFDEAFAYLRDELASDPRYFIFEWVGTEYGRIPKE
ncbi:hypothetical protein [Lysinibacillus xylanilyticus]|uniref:hypothetical protein n=1 Tax=Lysinibacillus xylanilyticus TaxID=582475 RepID=UPI003D02A86D